MMTTKILFSDLDGTLLDDEKRVSVEDLRSINRITKMGHRFVIATGRPIYSAKIVAKELGLYREGIFIAASNGGLLFDCGSEKIISQSVVDMELVDIIFKAAAKEKLHIHTYTDTHVVSLRKTEELEIYCKRIKMPYKILDRIPEDLPKAPVKMIVMSIKENSRKILEDFEKKYAPSVKGKIQSVFSNDFLLEYLPLRATKGNALRRLCELLDIPVADSIAAGDEANDISMLDAAGIAAVMQNGTDDTKSHADYVTKRSNNESGISEIIEKFIK